MNLPKQLDAPTNLDHICRLDYKDDSGFYRLSGIICTIGPSCRDQNTIYEMVKAGMNIARLNFSYDSHTDHFLSIQYIRQAEERYSKELGYDIVVGIAGDLKGREIRTGVLLGRNIVELREGDVVKLTTKPNIYNKCTKELVYIDYPEFVNDVKVGQKVFLDDNQISLQIQEIGLNFVVCQALMFGKLKSRVTVSVPEAQIRLPIVSEKDASDIKFCIDNQIDFLMLSKIYSMEDVVQIRGAIEERGKHMKIITKLENCRALEDFEGIANESDVLLFCRVDLAIEMKVGRVFLAQKSITARCIQKGKPIIIGPKILMSMLNSPVAFRSDIGDIANLLVDGADAIMLACVTAIGRCPVEAVKVLAGAAKEAEATVWSRRLYKDLMLKNLKAISGAHAVAISAVMTSVNVLAAAIIVLTASGRSALLVSRYRPRCPILAMTRNNDVARKLNVCRGVIPIKITGEKYEDWNKELENRINFALTKAHDRNLIRTSDAVVIVNPWKNATGFTNNIRVINAYFQKENSPCMESRDEKLVWKGPSRLFISY